MSPAQSLRNNSESPTDIEKVFSFICEQCKGVVNQMIKQSLKQKKPASGSSGSVTYGAQNKRSSEVLQKDPFEIIFKRFPILVEFENKKNYFKQEMVRLKSTIAPSTSKRKKIKVRRQHVFEDSFAQIDSMKPEELKQKFIIEFD